MNEKIRMLDDRTVEVNLPNVSGYERIAMECSASFAKIGGLVKERIEDLKTAVAEACLNAMEHGNRDHPDSRVVITMYLGDKNFKVSVMDAGDGMSVIPQHIDIKKKVEGLEPPNGLGLYLIQQLVDQVEFKKINGGGHVVKMVLRMEN
ncbi:MAG: ATP-binding protein [bacterium]|nr:ATP-binding protein [bacterium]